MNIPITSELAELFGRIVREHHSEDEWAAIESDDMFQTPHFTGGFDSTEREFCFSYYDQEGREFWFQISLKDVSAVLSGTLTSLIGQPADT